MRNLQTLRLPLLFRTLFTVGFVTLLMIDVFVLQNNNEVDKTKEITTAATMNNSIIHAKGVKEDLVDVSKHGDLSYVASKRKVPRGPDPIHNRFFTGFLLFIRIFWPPCTLRTSRIESRKFKTTTGKRISTVKAWRRSRENERSICWQNRFCKCNAPRFSFPFIWNRIF
ncbi:unnamed protein product [Brassica rapa]|uniref:Uncharacterized protein n=2 Tax=Brassica campestris TaxID=3711 RepID=A0A8D9M010_BRACM|nr:unnamed protein product [Brassica rapa]